MFVVFENCPKVYGLNDEDVRMANNLVEALQDRENFSLFIRQCYEYDVIKSAGENLAV